MEIIENVFRKDDPTNVDRAFGYLFEINFTAVHSSPFLLSHFI